MDVLGYLIASSKLEVDEGLNHIVLELDDDLQCDEYPQDPSEGGQYLDFLEGAFFEVGREKCNECGDHDHDAHFLSGGPKSCKVFPLGMKRNLLYASKC